MTPADRASDAVRLVRAPEAAHPGAPPRDVWLLQHGGRTFDLADAVGQAVEDVPGLLAAGFFTRARLAPLLDSGAWREVDAPARVRTPLPPRQVGKILCLGKNFRAHAAEFGEEPPDEPMFFNKLPETLRAHGDEVRVPAWYTARFDHEAELALLIGRPGRDIPAAQAFEHVAGYSVANDLTARSLQGSDRKRQHPWFRAKNFEGSCPFGPCLVPRDFLDVSDLRVTCRVRPAGASEFELRQDASTRDWITDIPAAIAWLSRHLPLHTGDLILMGTPAGVGPLSDGDEVVCAVEGIGELATRIRR